MTNDISVTLGIFTIFFILSSIVLVAQLIINKKNKLSEIEYDIQIIMPCVKERINFFQKFGIYNLGNVKTIIYCLVDNKEDFIEGWPDVPNLKVELVEYPECESSDIVEKACYKLFKFLYEMDIKTASKAKWTLKIDDDCFNNITEIDYFLNYEYDYNKELYIVGETRSEIHGVEKDMLEKYDLWDKINERFEHELEGCILSRAAFVKIMDNDLTKELFKEKYLVSKKRQSYTDQLLGAVAKLNKIFPTQQNGSMITSGRGGELLKCLVMSREERNKLGNYQMKYACHYHPCKDHICQEIIEHEMREKGLSEKEVRDRFPTPTPTPTNTLTPTPFLTPTPTATKKAEKIL